MSLEDKVIRRAVIKEMSRSFYNRLKKPVPEIKRNLKDFGLCTLGVLEASNFHSIYLIDKADEHPITPGSLSGIMGGMLIEGVSCSFVVLSGFMGEYILPVAYFSMKGITHGGALLARGYRRTKKNLEGRANTA